MQYKLYRDAETGKFDTIGIGELYATVTLDQHIHEHFELSYSRKIKIKLVVEGRIIFYNKIAAEKYKDRTSITVPLTSYPISQYLFNLFTGSFNI